MTARFRMATAAGWGFADQALSSLTNFALSFLVARTFDTDALGAFSLVFTTYLFFLNISRPLAMQPLLIRYSGVPRAMWHDLTQQAMGLTLLIGVAGAVATCGAGLVLGGVLEAPLIATGVMLPGLLVQDSWRLAFFSSGRGRAAFLNDLIWALLLFPGLALGLLVWHVDLGALIAIWGAAASAAAIVGIAQARLLPRPDRGLAWLRTQGTLAGPLTLESIISVGLSQVTTIGVAVIAGLAAVGTLRAGQLLLGPLLVIFQGAQLIAIPEGKRLLARSRDAVRRACRLYGTAIAAIVMGWGVVMYLTPDALGTVLLGQNWGPAHAVILPVSISWGLGFAAAALTVGTRVLARARRVLVAGASSSVANLVGQLVGAAADGAFGAASGGAIGNFIGLRVAFSQLEGALGDPVEAA